MFGGLIVSVFMNFEMLCGMSVGKLGNVYIVVMWMSVYSR